MSYLVTIYSKKTEKSGKAYVALSTTKARQGLQAIISLYFNSVRDLLRALRNKKHHYNELPEVTKLMYGRIPDQFTDYWTSRFPKLLIHSWMAMHCIKNEPSFAKYFDKDYDFVKVWIFISFKSRLWDIWDTGKFTFCTQ